MSTSMKRVSFPLNIKSPERTTESQQKINEKLSSAKKKREVKKKAAAEAARQAAAAEEARQAAAEAAARQRLAARQAEEVRQAAAVEAARQAAAAEAARQAVEAEAARQAEDKRINDGLKMLRDMQEIFRIEQNRIRERKEKAAKEAAKEAVRQAELARQAEAERQVKEAEATAAAEGAVKAAEATAAAEGAVKAAEATAAEEAIEDKSIWSKLKEIAPNISQNKKYIAVGALALGLGSFGYKKYKDLKLRLRQEDEIKKLKNEKLKIFEEKLKKMKIHKQNKEKMIRYFLIASIGAILLRRTIKSHKKGGNININTLKRRSYRNNSIRKYNN